MGEKTEKATPKKLRDAKKKGQVAKSQDLPGAITFMVSIAATLYMSMYLYQQLGAFVVSTFQQIGHANLSTIILNYFVQSLFVIFLCSIPVLGIVSMVGVLSTFIVVGPVFAPEVFKFDIKKFDPVQNLKAKFKLKTLIELLKQTLKIGIACYIIYDVMWKSLPVLTKAVGMPMTGALMIFHTFLMEVIIKVGIFFFIIAVFDLLYQKHTFSKEMMMEKFEIKQEYKNTEGDPHIKGKRKQIAQEIAYREGPAAGVQKAAAVVTNPTHLAIAIAYEKAVDPAPYISAMGEGTMAQQIVKLANEFNIPVMRNIPLAHELWKSEIYGYVPEDSYEAIAEILRWVASLQPGSEPTTELET